MMGDAGMRSSIMVAGCDLGRCGVSGGGGTPSGGESGFLSCENGSNMDTSSVSCQSLLGVGIAR